MSAYKYYGFQAIDRPLSREQIQTLRGYSTRARITTTSFANEYSFGSFKAKTCAEAVEMLLDLREIAVRRHAGQILIGAWRRSGRPARGRGRSSNNSIRKGCGPP
jgi:hypothetical protein